MKIKLMVIASLVFVCLLGSGCTHAEDFDSRLRSIVEPYRFSIVAWESRTIPQEVNRWISGKDEEVDNEIGVVIEYFAVVEQIRNLEWGVAAINAGNGQGDLSLLEAELNILQEQRTTLTNSAERILEKQIKETLTQQGICHPFEEYIDWKVGFPPVNFKLEKPPNLLVISPRERIESMREITLQQGLSLAEMAEIEAAADKLGVSSLVLELGGLGVTYPTFVTNDAGLGFTISVATEEWVHQYLAFKPLGFLYLLDIIGVSRDYEIATMNETLASMVSDEIGAMVFQEYYAQYENGVSQKKEEDSESLFNREMREIRRAVDSYLAAGEIEKAEEFMEQKRAYLASKGYYIRKLNQAYFAFYGTYADAPTSISPIGLELKGLRSQSVSLESFLETAASLTSHQDLLDIIK